MAMVFAKQESTTLLLMRRISLFAIAQTLHNAYGTANLINIKTDCQFDTFHVSFFMLLI